MIDRTQLITVDRPGSLDDVGACACAALEQNGEDTRPADPSLS